MTQHFGNIFKERELIKEVVCKEFLRTTQHGAILGKTQINRIILYNLDVIISVGYSVKSKEGTQFRIWANQGIFFNGQVFDAYVFLSGIIKKAKTEIILIDNFIDETVLLQLSKRNADVKATIYTGKISPQLLLDLEKHNQQYPPIEIKTLFESHDRFIIIDQKELYHIGASLKDLGKKWFAFSRMDTLVVDLLKKLERL